MYSAALKLWNCSGKASCPHHPSGGCWPRALSEILVLCFPLPPSPYFGAQAIPAQPVSALVSHPWVPQNG